MREPNYGCSSKTQNSFQSTWCFFFFIYSNDKIYNRVSKKRLAFNKKLVNLKPFDKTLIVLIFECSFIFEALKQKAKSLNNNYFCNAYQTHQTNAQIDVACWFCMASNNYLSCSLSLSLFLCAFCLNVNFKLNCYICFVLSFFRFSIEQKAKQNGKFQLSDEINCKVKDYFRSKFRTLYCFIIRDW